MKIALLMDYIKGIAGGEKLLLYFAKRYDADIYTGYINWDKTYPEFKNYNIKTLSKISRIPLLKQNSLVKAFKEIELVDYDATICLGFYSIYSSWKNIPVIWSAYGVSPIFYKRADVPDEFIKQGLIRRIGEWIWKRRMQKDDKEIIQKYIEKIVAISKYSSQAFKDYYNRDTEIIPPPVDMKKHYNRPAEPYYLIVSRLEHGKRVDLAINAFKDMPDKNLVVVGTGSLEKKLKKMASKNVYFHKNLKEENLLELYAHCIAFIGTAFYDDWSMPMIEAMASGKPCIGVKQGAYPEVIQEKTGVLVKGTPEGIARGVGIITGAGTEYFKETCIKRAKECDVSNFYKKWDKLLKEVTK